MSRKRRKWNVDPEATKARGFLDRRSFVNWDGKEFLGKKDWEYRRMFVYFRDGGKCTECNQWVDELDFEAHHHPVTRGQGGDDKADNLKTICRPCHRKQHPQVQLRKVSLG